jgi:hypothetical protein
MGQSKVSLKSVGAFYAATPGQPAATTRPLKRLPKNHLLPRQAIKNGYQANTTLGSINDFGLDAL